MTGYSILIADDEPEIRELLRLYLEKDGYRVLESQNGIETLELLKKELVDLLVLDIMMPELDGFSVLRKVRKEKRRSKRDLCGRSDVESGFMYTVSRRGTD